MLPVSTPSLGTVFYPCLADTTSNVLFAMRTHYPEQIRESEEYLERLERSLRGQAVCDRVKMLRLLKSQAYDSRRTLAPVLGYSERQLQRWWKLYKRSGIDALIEEKAVGGSTERITDEAWTSLSAAMRSGHVKQLKEAQVFLLEHFDIEYQSLQGLSDMIKRRTIDDLMAQRTDGKFDDNIRDLPSSFPPEGPIMKSANAA